MQQAARVRVPRATPSEHLRPTERRPAGSDGPSARPVTGSGSAPTNS